MNHDPRLDRCRVPGMGAPLAETRQTRPRPPFGGLPTTVTL